MIITFYSRERISAIAGKSVMIQMIFYPNRKQFSKSDNTKYCIYYNIRIGNTPTQSHSKKTLRKIAKPSVF